MDDATLVAAARGGDREAFATIYDRYADRLHDFCFSVLRDRDGAADAMQDTFVIASQRLGQLRDPSKLRSWLFAIARNESLRYARARTRAQPTENVGADLAAEHADPEQAVTAGAAQQVVWEAAAGLSDRDRVLLDLHVRQGLDGQDLADAVGVTPSHAYVLVNRLKTQVERSIGALLVARQGSRDCEELQSILARWDGTFSPLIRKRVARHVERCDVCSETKKKVASPLALLSAMAAVPAPAFLREETLHRVDLASATMPAGGGGETSVSNAGHGAPGSWKAGPDGFPPSMYPKPWKWVALAATAAALVGLLVGAWWAIAHEDGDQVVAAEANTHTVVAETTTTTGPEPSSPVTAPVVTEPTVTTEPGTGPAPAPTAPPAVDPPAPAPTEPPPPPDREPPVITSISADPKAVCEEGSPGVHTSTAVVSATDASGIVSATLRSSPGGESTMSGGGGTYSGTLGPATGYTEITWSVRVTDSAGNTTEAVGPSVVADYCVP